MQVPQLDGLAVAEVMERWPVTVGVFNRRRMACPGCVMAPFMTVTEAAASYGLPPAELATDLLHAIDAEAIDVCAIGASPRARCDGES